MSTSDHKDVLGRALQLYWQTGSDIPVKVWMNGQRQMDLMPSYFFRGYRDMRGTDRTSLRLAKGCVLDVGAGAGAHSFVLQQRGFDVTALERSSGACTVMKERGINRIIQEDIFRLRGIPFDTILLMMNGLGIAGTARDTLKLFRHLRRMLTKGGQIIGDSTDILYATMNSLGGFEEKGSYYGEVTYEMEFQGFRTGPFPWLYLDPALLAELADKAGLECEIVSRTEDYHYLARLVSENH